MLTRFSQERVAVLGGGRLELAERLLRADLDLTAPAALVLHEPDGYYVLDYEELLELNRIWALRVRLDTVPNSTEDVAAMLEGAVNLTAAVAPSVASGEQPDSRAVEIRAGRVEAVWAPASEALDTMGPEPLDAQPVAANGDQPADGRIIRRTPHLSAPKQLPLVLGADFRVTVWTDTAPARDDEESEEVVIELPPGVHTVDLGVLLRTSPHFRVAGAYFDTLRVERDRPDSEPVRFEVEVVDLDEPGPAAVDATLMWEGRECGRVRRKWSWPEGLAQAAAEPPGAVSVTTGVVRPDLSISIRSPTNDERQQWAICAPGLPGYESWTKPHEWSSRSTSPAFIRDKLDRFVDRTLDPSERRSELRKAGREFWNAAPKVFHDAVWALIDKQEDDDGRETRATIYVATDDPLLPWELMMPTREKTDGTPDDRPTPLGVEFALGRRLRGDERPPPELLPVRDSLLIAPRYGSEERQLNPEAEFDVLVRHFEGRRLAEASKKYFEEHLARNGASLVHFVCHGEAGVDSETLYLDKDEAYSSGDVRDSDGFKALCAQHHPIVFLNACDAGQAHMTIGPGGAGFPQAFTELGARAVIAPLWPVSVLNAPKVAVELYTRAASEPDRGLADILADLRERSYSGPDESFDDSWAAYCLYGDPCAPLRHASS